MRRDVRIQESARRVGSLAAGLVFKDEKQLLIFEHRMQLVLAALQLKNRVTRARLPLRLSQDVRHGQLLRRGVWHPLGHHPVVLSRRIPVQASETFPELALLILQANRVPSAAMNNEHGEIAELDQVRSTIDGVRPQRRGSFHVDSWSSMKCHLAAAIFEDAEVSWASRQGDRSGRIRPRGILAIMQPEEACNR